MHFCEVEYEFVLLTVYKEVEDLILWSECVILVWETII